jgi:hypothetical protein
LEKCYHPECNEKVDFFNGKRCKLCGNSCCFKHIQPENHDCPKTTPVKYLRKTWLRRYGLNVTTGRYIVVCDQCQYVSQISSLSEFANQERTSHIQATGCVESKVFLEEDVSEQKIPENINFDEVIPYDRQFYVCCHCRPPRKFTRRDEYVAHHFNHN